MPDYKRGILREGLRLLWLAVATMIDKIATNTKECGLALIRIRTGTATDVNWKARHTHVLAATKVKATMSIRSESDISTSRPPLLGIIVRRRAHQHLLSVPPRTYNDGAAPW
jgi:hypothetical protein